jgi:hypothetical protein
MAEHDAVAPAGGAASGDVAPPPRPGDAGAPAPAARGGTTALTFAPGTPVTAPPVATAVQIPARTRSATGRPTHHAAPGGRAEQGWLVVGAAALIGSLGAALSAAALYGAHRMHAQARDLALIAAGVATLTVLITSGILLARLLTASGAGAGTRRPARRPIASVVSGALLAAAAILLGAAAAIAVIGPTATDVPRLAVRTGHDPAGKRTLRVDATLGGLAIGTPVGMSLTGLGDGDAAAAGGAGNVVLASVVQRAGGNTTDTVRVDALVPDVKSVQVDVSLTGRLCQALIPMNAVIRVDEFDVTCRPD